MAKLTFDHGQRAMAKRKRKHLFCLAVDGQPARLDGRIVMSGVCSPEEAGLIPALIRKIAVDRQPQLRKRRER